MAYVTYGNVKTCPCCISSPVAFDGEEGRDRRRRCVRHYRAVSTVQLGMSGVALVSGATSAVLAFLNPSFPYVICFALISSVLMLIAGVFGIKAGRANMDTEIAAGIKRNVIVHYVLSVLGCTFCILASVFSAVGVGYCFSPESSELRDQCSPHRELRIAFLFVDVVLGFLLFLTCIVGCVLFCMHARTLGFSNRQQTMENELNTLRAQVAVLSQAQQAQQGLHHLPPPAYSEISEGQGGFSYVGLGGGGNYGGAYLAPSSTTTSNSAGKGQWPAGY